MSINIHPSQCRDNKYLEHFSLNDVLKVTEKGRRFSLRFKRALWNASNQTCAYCGVLIKDHKSMHVDHFIPLNNGGQDSIDNYVCSCATCNTSKCARSIEELRLAIGLRQSSLIGIISPMQAKQLIELGIDLPITIPEFHFEKSGGGL